jgi:hypothetical protein
LFNAKVEAPSEEYNQALLYFEEFCIQPMRLNLSFVRTAHISTVDAYVKQADWKKKRQSNVLALFSS